MATGPVSVSGLGSNLPIDSIVSKLMVVEQLPIQQMQAQVQSYTSQITALSQIKGALSTFQSAVATLASPSNFNTIQTSSSSSSIATVSASSGTQAGSYQVQVNQLAQSQRLVTTAGYSSTTSVIGGGTLTFTFGTTSSGTSGTTFTANANQTSASVTIPTNATLQDIANDINSANIGVQASIINDGVNGNRLVYSATNTGAANSLSISTNSGSALSAFTYDATSSSTQPVQQLQAAQDAKFTLNGISIDSASNTNTTAVNGLTFNLAQTGSATLSVTQSSSGATQAIKTFVSAYNTLQSTLNQMTAVDPSTATAGTQATSGPLTGDFAVFMVQQQLASAFNTVPAGMSNSPYRLPADVGLTFDKNGTLTVDSAKLQSALTSNPQAVAALFGSVASSTDSQVSYASSTSSSQVGNYAVNLTATQHGVLEGSTFAANTFPMTINSAPSFEVTVDGVDLTGLTVASGSYNTASDLATAVQSAINGGLAGAPNNTGAGKGVTVTVDPNSGALVLQSNSTGPTSSVKTVSGLSFAGFADGSNNTGQTNVAGTIGGYAAVGSGNSLVGATGTPVAGLSLNITGGPTGSRGSVNFTTGFAGIMNNLLTTMESSTGAVSAEINGINTSITQVNNQISAEQTRLSQVQTNYQNEMNAMDSTVQQMSSLGSYLTQVLYGTSSSSSSSSSGGLMSNMSSAANSSLG